MTLRQQISILISSIIIILLIGNLTVTLTNSKNYFERQLNSRAYDAATSLALSMSSVESTGDHVTLKRMIDVLYDRGFFESISLKLVSGEVLYTREAYMVQNDVPVFFKEWVQLDVVVATTDVTQQWQRLGELNVKSHTEFAYEDLWKIAKAEFLWFVLTAIATLTLMHILLGWLFRPLKEVEQQALDVCERNLYELPKLPASKELNQVVTAMNKMVRKLKQIFSEQAELIESLRVETYHDDVTKLLNRHGFDDRCEHFITSSESSRGLLILIQLEHFSDFNQTQGREAGDELLVNMSEALNDWLKSYPTAIAGRRTGADFSLFIPVTDGLQAKEIAQQCFNFLSANRLVPEQDVAFHVGGALVEASSSLPLLLSQADMALRQAQQQRKSVVIYDEQTQSNNELSSGQWKERLQALLDEQHIELHFQPSVIDKHGNHEVAYLEVFCRIKFEGELIPAARFWPMVERHQLSVDYDLLVIQTLLEQVSQNGRESDAPKFCVNVSAASLLSSAFQTRLLNLLKDYKQQAQYLCLEISEASLQHVEDSLAQLAPHLKEFGIGLGVDQVGTGASAFAYLQRLPLDYLRIDGSFNRGVAKASDHKFFVRSMVQIAHSLDLLVLADGVENDIDVDALRQTGVDGYAGYYFSPPIAELQAAIQWEY